MSRLSKATLIGGLALLTFAPFASAQRRVAQPAPAPAPAPQRTIIVRRYYAYDPFFWDRYSWYYGYPPYGSAYYPSTTGQVKLKTDRSEAMVYVDGGFAGKVKDNKNLSLTPGNHKIELRDSEGKVIAQRTVNVMLGKTVKLDFRG